MTGGLIWGVAVGALEWVDGRKGEVSSKIVGSWSYGGFSGCPVMRASRIWRSYSRVCRAAQLQQKRIRIPKVVVFNSNSLSTALF